jgi:hypothetical protein
MKLFGEVMATSLWIPVLWENWETVCAADQTGVDINLIVSSMG